MRFLKNGVVTAVKMLGAAVVIALAILLLEVLAGVFLVEVDSLFHQFSAGQETEERRGPEPRAAPANPTKLAAPLDAVTFSHPLTPTKREELNGCGSPGSAAGLAGADGGAGRNHLVPPGPGVSEPRDPSADGPGERGDEGARNPKPVRVHR